MVINIRHFIITIISIFLSLGIGIFIGAIMDSQQLFIQQQNELVSQIEDDFNGFKEKNNELINEITKLEDEKRIYDEFTNRLYTILTDGKLKDFSVVLLRINDDEGKYEELNRLLEESGAKIAMDFSIQYNNDKQKNYVEKYFENNMKENNINDLIILTTDNHSNMNMIEIPKYIDIPVIEIIDSKESYFRIESYNGSQIKIFTNLDNKLEQINLLLYLINIKYEFKKDYGDRLVT